VKTRLGKIAVALAVMVTLGAGLTACTAASTPTGMCGWVVGDGQNNNDAKIHDTVYPGESVTLQAGEESHYVPCGPRNFIITDGSVEGLGDQTTPVEAMTKDLTPVKVQVTAYWELNQSQEALTQFAELCNKYECYSSEAEAGDVNSATVGWNNMLKENFGPAIEKAMTASMSQITDAIWKTNDAAETEKLEQLLSASFKETIRVPTGYNENLFCGSGNSGWDNSDKPGEAGNDFTCSEVRFSVTSTDKDASAKNGTTTTNQTQLDTEASQARYDKSVPLYGDQTHYWLGVQDATGKCPKESTCNIYLGNPPQN